MQEKNQNLSRTKRLTIGQTLPVQDLLGDPH